MICGMNSANHFLQGMHIPPSITKEEVGSWASVKEVKKVLNEKIKAAAADNKAFKNIKVIAREIPINETLTHPTVRGGRMMAEFVGKFSEEEQMGIENINRFIVSRNGHYYVYEKVDGHWQEWDEQHPNQPKFLGDLSDCTSVMTYAFSLIQNITGNTGGIIIEKPQSEEKAQSEEDRI